MGDDRSDVRSLLRTLKSLADEVEKIDREREVAQSLAERLAREANDQCDRIFELERALLPVAKAGGPGSRFARAALLGMDEDDPKLAEAWAASRFAKEAA